MTNVEVGGEKWLLLSVVSIAGLAGCASAPEVRGDRKEQASCVRAVGSLDREAPQEFIVGCAEASQLQAREVDAASCTRADGSSGRYEPPALEKNGRRPRYSLSALRNNVAGEGRYLCLVDEAGKLARCTVVQSLGEMDSRVIEAFSTATFAPARCESRPVGGRIELSTRVAPAPACPSNPRELVDPDAPKGNACELGGAAPAPMSAPRRISGAMPTYTREAYEHGQRGVIVGRCTISASGDMTNCGILCSDAPLMDAVVLDALETWKMEPVRCGDTPIPFPYRVPIQLAPPAHPPEAPVARN